MQSIEKIVIIGAGSLASNLAVVFYNNGLQILQIVNRTLSNAAALAEKVNASYTDTIDEIDLQADLYIVAVSDAGIPEVLQKLIPDKKFVVHTAGSIDMEVIRNYSDNYGVFYPLQTFSKNELIPFKNIPVCIEANSPANEVLLFQLACRISDNVQKITSYQRKILHVAAVFACNFSSYMHLIADKILTENQLDFNILKPLILRTAEKILTHQPEKELSGPARRNDAAVIQQHIQLLASNPEYQEIYKLISNDIVKHFHP